MEKHVILGVHVTNRMRKAGEVQKIFSKYGCCIKTRVGLHEVHKDYCSASGLILLEMVGAESKAKELAAKLSAIAGVQVKKMVFSHPK